ncbi:MAG: holo-ACP synthase [Bradyrhizobiaceae bacterium]|nr:holo-ACP synthase [Bradyrhizobiaceae bacterium]
MIVGIGTDVVDVPRIMHSFEQYGQRFLQRVFTDVEIAYCEQFGETRFLHYAARFAAKEAFSKAIGTGMRDGMAFKNVGIRNEQSGMPVMELYGQMLERWNDFTIHVTLSHTATVAVAVVVIESRSNNDQLA